ncbi:MAG: exonuclease domain-containing protein [Paracoccaceae bacterium]
MTEPGVSAADRVVPFERGAITQRWSLRLRVFLFFALMTLGAMGGLAAGVVIGLERLDTADDAETLALVAAVAGFIVLGFNMWVWLLFDEHFARPVQALSSDLLARSLSDVEGDLDTSQCRYLGALAPAARTIAADLTAAKRARREAIQRETERLAADRAALGSLVDAVPTGVVLLAEDGRVVAYNAAAASALLGRGWLGLDRSLDEALAPGSVAAVVAALDANGGEAQARSNVRGDRDVRLDVATADGSLRLGLRARRVVETRRTGTAGIMLAFDPPACAGERAPERGARELRLLGARDERPLPERRIDDVALVVFDTETTGLDPDHGDEIVQIAAVRIAGGRVLSPERFDTLVDPGRSIPAASTAIHGIDAAMVEGAPDVETALRAFHGFAHGAVLVAHNAPFDLAFLKRRERAIGLAFDHPVLDTGTISAAIFGRRAEHTLDALAARLDVTIPEAARHTALGDARATAAVFLKLVPLMQSAGMVTVADAVARTGASARTRA